ncbi:MAG: hypothetical protein ACE5F2_01765 [Candidatus Paceibacteria bacterium]
MPNDKIFLFASSCDSEKVAGIRDFLKILGIQNIVLADLDYFFSKIVRYGYSGDSIIEGINIVIEDNPCIYPIIFYGGNENRMKVLLKFCNFKNRRDIGWVLSPYNHDVLLRLVRNIKFGLV